jgi:hypothetical protein
MAAGPASYGMTDTLGRMHSDAQFAGSSSVLPRRDDGLPGHGQQTMVGATVALPCRPTCCSTSNPLRIITISNLLQSSCIVRGFLMPFSQMVCWGLVHRPLLSHRHATAIP